MPRGCIALRPAQRNPGPVLTVILDPLPPEARLLFVATREPAWDPGEVRRLASAPLNWAVLRGLATQERLLTVLWPRLCEAGVAVPEPHEQAFRMQASVMEFQLSFAELVLRQVVREARDLDVDLLLLKGAALALTVYGAFRDRPMGDLDVLARPAGASRLWNRLREDGWLLEYEGGRTFYEEHHHLPPLVRGGGIGVVLEIHRTLLPPRGPFVDGGDSTWRTARPLRLDEGSVRVLAPEAQLLHLSIHFAWSHMAGRGLARTVRDVAAVWAEGEIDGPSFVERAQAMRAETSAYWTLRLARGLGGAAVPDAVLEALAPPRPRWVLDRLERAYVEAALFRSCPSHRLLRTLWTAGMAPGASGHGAHRPWEADEDFRHDVEGAVASEVDLASRLARLPAGIAFLRRAVSGSLGGPRVAGAEPGEE